MSRRMISTVLAAVGALLTVDVLVPKQPASGTPVLVSARALPAGHVVGPDDVLVAKWPADLTPANALASPVAALGRSLTAAVDDGEVLTRARIRGSGALAARSGRVAVHVPLVDPVAAALVSPGDRVDLLDVTSGAVLADRAVVLAVDADVGASLSPLAVADTAAGRGVVVDLEPSQATAVARGMGGAGTGLFLVLHPAMSS